MTCQRAVRERNPEFSLLTGGAHRLLSILDTHPPLSPFHSGRGVCGASKVGSGPRSAPSTNPGLRPSRRLLLYGLSRLLPSVSRFDHAGWTTTVNHGLSGRPDRWIALYVGLLVPSSRWSRRSEFRHGPRCSRGSRFSLDQGSGAGRSDPVWNPSLELETAVAERDVTSDTCSRASPRFTLDEGCGLHPSCTCDQLSTRRRPTPHHYTLDEGCPLSSTAPFEMWERDVTSPKRDFGSSRRSTGRRPVVFGPREDSLYAVPFVGNLWDVHRD